MNAPQLPFQPADAEHLDITALEQWLWDAACVIRGATDAPKFKDFILPLIFYKRLADVFVDEFAAKVALFGSEAAARQIVIADHTAALKAGRPPIIRFYIPQRYGWQQLRGYRNQNQQQIHYDDDVLLGEINEDKSLGEFVTTAMRKVAELNPDLRGVLDVKDYNEAQSGQRTLADDRLEQLIETISRHRLGRKNAEPDILGRAYEYLLRKFAEGQGQSAGEFYTPKEVGWLLAAILDPAPHREVYDPTCGSGGLLIKARLFYELRHKDDAALLPQAPRLFGQELNGVTFAMAKMNMFLHDYTHSAFAIGDTLRHPGFGAAGVGLRQFDYIVANPMWNQKGYDEAFYRLDASRFKATPPSNTADWGWLQHIGASLNERGRAAVVLDTGAVSRGSGSKNKDAERDIRKRFVEEDLIEGVILLPENLFYNTSAPGIVVLLNRAKPEERRGQFLLINASRFFLKGKPKNELTQAGIDAIAEVYRTWESRDKLSRVVTLAEVRAADYNLSPSQFVEVGEKVEHRPLAEILQDLAVARGARELADKQLTSIIKDLGL